MTKPRITLIMPSFNQAAFLEEAICSVLSQNYSNLEFMILDGGSTDGSCEIIQRYEDHLSYWYSRPDGGQSAAIDHGMALATGDLAGWLNSDDFLLPDTLNQVAKSYENNSKGVLFSGNLVFIDASGVITGFLRMPPRAEWFAKHGIFVLSQPGSFFQVAAYHQAGRIRHDYHYVMDIELYLRILLNVGDHVYLDQYLAAFRRHDQQKTSSQIEKKNDELIKLAQELTKIGLIYRHSRSSMLYLVRQILNGNYYKKIKHTKKFRGQYWRSWAQEYFKSP